MKWYSMQAVLMIVLLGLFGCAGPSSEAYRDANMDFGAIKTVAILPLANLTRETSAGERVRDILTTKLLETGAVYVIPPGEVARGIARIGFANPAAPSTEELIKLGGVIKADAIITGIIREYGEVRSGSAVANGISFSLQMTETQTGRLIWSTSTERGGIGVTERLFGGGGELMNTITEKAVDDVIKKLFQ